MTAFSGLLLVPCRDAVGRLSARDGHEGATCAAFYPNDRYPKLSAGAMLHRLQAGLRPKQTYICKLGDQVAGEGEGRPRILDHFLQPSARIHCSWRVVSRCGHFNRIEADQQAQQ